MGDYAIILETVDRGGHEMSLPYVMRIDHHIAGPVELHLDALRGGHALHAAVAVCVFNNVTRLALERGVALQHASVRVRGGFTDDGRSTGITFDIDVQGNGSEASLRKIGIDAAADSTIVEALRHPTEVMLGETRATSTATR